MAEIDFDAQTTRIEFVDGRVIFGPKPPAMPKRSVVRRSRTDFERRLLFLGLDDGETLELDIGAPGQPVPPEAPVLYLDQLHWIGLAQSLWAPHRLRTGDREAVATLIALARDQRILLPIASAHLNEMGPVTGRRRRDLRTWTRLHGPRGPFDSCGAVRRTIRERVPDLRCWSVVWRGRARRRRVR
jgi:hypothetical protein